MHSLVRAFAAMIDQKLKVINMLSARARPAAELYTSTSPIHGASVGMHLRHSLDHCTRLADAVTTLSSVPGMEPTPTLRYDVRERGTGAELDPTLAAAQARTTRDTVVEALEADQSLLDRPVFAEFALSNDAASFHKIPSTVARELAFVSHHAYHHAAMIRLISITHLGIDEQDLPPNLGRERVNFPAQAPSTLIYDRRQQAHPGALQQA